MGNCNGVSSEIWNLVKNIPIKVGYIDRIWADEKGVHVEVTFSPAILAVKNPLLKIKLFLRDRG